MTDVSLDFLRALFLGLLQGLTEFLPISSSAHLAIVPQVLGWADPGAAFTAVIQIGTELAVLLYFWRDIWTIGSGWLRGLFSSEARREREWAMGWFIIIGSTPIVLLGIALKDAIERDFRSLWLIGIMLITFGVILGVSDRVGGTSRRIENLTWSHAVLFGLAQAAALVPGVSRSGATISMGRFLGYERAAATRYAFLLAIPAVVGAGLFELQEIPGGDNAYGVMPTAVATIVSFGVGLAVIHWLLKYLSTHSFLPFVVYRIAFGGLTLGLLSAGVLAA